MRHPDEFYFCFDPAMYDQEQEEEKQIIARASLTSKQSMTDGNIHFMFPPESRVTYIMLKYNLSRGEAEFMLHWNKYHNHLP